MVRYLAYKPENLLEFQNPFKKKKMLGRQPQAREAKTGGFPRFLRWLVYLASSGSVKDLVHKNKVHGGENEARFLFGLHTHAHMYMNPPQ